ncbi:TonB-dependent receptor [Erythrobacter sp. KY5]|uniref:TonB-dependent receptor domain-containing protein n=1 Tax=Erythrobacter sp. KY5 TaxID=2011159 RepID=UPI000DBF166E|nr:TonB-dependent receptor [Erythrobacter sp. KY5]AWW75423.1 TonB-dependent receptor [Erythrobacter sp. KY5]
MHISQTRRRLFGSCAALSIAVAASPASAQDLEAPSEDVTSDAAASENAAQNRIVVTGSRILSDSAASTQPLQVLDAANIAQSGVTNIQDLLLENPVFGAPTFARTNNAFGVTGTGVATVDLRNLGIARTLVLVNGRRVVGGLAGTNTVDLNVIPTQFIGRIDILTGGASSLYGSDAVAGVVNFVYRDDLEGLNLEGRYGITEQGDAEDYRLNATFGGSIDDGRGRFMLHAGYSDQGQLLSRERSNTLVDDIDLFVLSGDPADFGTPSEPFFSSFPPQGRFDVNGTPSNADDFTFNPSGVLQPCFSVNSTPTCTAFDGSPASGPNGFNRQFFRTLASPVQRYVFAGTADYEIAPGVTAFVEGTYVKTQSARIIEPFASSSSGTNGLFPATGRAPIETRVLVDSDGDGVLDSSEIRLNPLVPDEIVAAASDLDGDGLRDIGFVRRLLEVGERTNDTTRDFFRVVAGLQGEFADGQFRWDVSYNYGQTTENQRSAGALNVPNFQQAFAAVADVDDVDGDGDTTEVICASADARAQGCAPVNIFGLNAISPEALAYIDAPGSFQTEIEQRVFQANLSGELFEIWGGPVGFATGVEYREEASLADFDSLTNQGLNASNQIPDTQGEFDVIEGFVEVRVPILSDVPFFRTLELAGAVRLSDYSTVGSVTSWNGQVLWEPIDDIRFRGTYSRAVRAPNIGELFSAQSQTFPPGLTDPCVGIGPSGGGTLGDTCRSFAGVNENIALNGVFTLNQADIQGISGFNGGNPNLAEETADTLTLGLVINPRSIEPLRNLTLTVDYFDIEIENVIAAPTRPFTLDQCFNKGNRVFCDLITRRAAGDSTNSAGSLEFVNAIQSNGALRETEGVDVTVQYNTSLDGIGLENANLNLSGAYTHLIKLNFLPAVGQPANPLAGEVGSAKDRFTTTALFDFGAISWGLTGTYIGASTEDDQFCSAFGLDAGCFRQGAEFNLDTQVVFDIDELQIFAGVDNLLDNDAPNLLTGTTFNATSTDTASGVYDILGRRYYAGVRFRF